jgi:hypothetical protein
MHDLLFYILYRADTIPLHEGFHILEEGSRGGGVWC